MELVRNLRRLWRHQLFRRLLTVRIAVQSCDGLLQVALASFVLFSTQRQPDAASIATVLAITLLPFSIAGPFVSVVLDRLSRRQALVTVDLARAVLALVLAGLVAADLLVGAYELIFYALVLVLMSLNRFVLAALAASLPHTIDPDEYMVANSVMPTIGPVGTVIGAGIGFAAKLLLGGQLSSSHTDGILFGVAAIGYVVSAGLARRIPRDALGPDGTSPATRARDIAAGLREALVHLRERSPAACALLTIAAHRLPYGVFTVATILVFRNHFHPVTEVDAALADLGLVAGATAGGFLAAAVVTPILSRRLGTRGWMIGTLVGSAVLQVLPGAIYQRWTLIVAAFGLGVLAQSIKICTDTVVHAHVDDDYKGRTFVFYDMIFNLTLVIAAYVTALIMPADGRSVAVMIGLAICYLLVAVVFAVVSGRIGNELMNRGQDESATTQGV
ncbi:MFS transporter [Propionibacteriaceae bacterium Y1685]|uniref:MFS transporter n=1 Tax=Microlunatus sp. Y1700 TaxID=3418487 RepID=UPI003B7F0614